MDHVRRLFSALGVASALEARRGVPAADAEAHNVANDQPLTSGESMRAGLKRLVGGREAFALSLKRLNQNSWKGPCHDAFADHAHAPTPDIIVAAIEAQTVAIERAMLTAFWTQLAGLTVVMAVAMTALVLVKVD